MVNGRSPLDLAKAVEIEREIATDLGGAESLSKVTRALVADLAFAIVLRDLLSAHLAAVGPLTARNQRRAALQAWDQASQRVERLAVRVGLGKAAKKATWKGFVNGGDK